MNISINEIIEYWEPIIYEGDMGTDWDEANIRCWRCGDINKLEKCHIIPKSIGGGYSVDNLVLLCKYCHREAPNIKSKTALWEWIKLTSCGTYGTFWGKNVDTRFKNIFGVTFAEYLCIEINNKINNVDNFNWDVFLNYFKSEVKNNLYEISYHFGKGKSSYETTIPFYIKGIAQSIIKKMGSNGKIKA